MFLVLALSVYAVSAVELRELLPQRGNEWKSWLPWSGKQDGQVSLVALTKPDCRACQSFKTKIESANNQLGDNPIVTVDCTNLPTRRAICFRDGKDEFGIAGDGGTGWPTIVAVDSDGKLVEKYTKTVHDLPAVTAESMVKYLKDKNPQPENNDLNRNDQSLQSSGRSVSSWNIILEWLDRVVGYKLWYLVGAYSVLGILCEYCSHDTDQPGEWPFMKLPKAILKGLIVRPVLGAWNLFRWLCGCCCSKPTASEPAVPKSGREAESSENSCWKWSKWVSGGVVASGLAWFGWKKYGEEKYHEYVKPPPKLLDPKSWTDDFVSNWIYPVGAAVLGLSAVTWWFWDSIGCSISSSSIPDAGIAQGTVMQRAVSKAREITGLGAGTVITLYVLLFLGICAAIFFGWYFYYNQEEARIPLWDEEHGVIEVPDEFAEPRRKLSCRPQNFSGFWPNRSMS